MKRITPIALLLLALPLFADEPRGYIVEYRSGALAPQLEADAPQLRVKRRFSRLFRGAAIELKEGESVDAIARLPFVARVHVDARVVAYETQRTVPHPAPRATLLPPGAARGASIVVAVIDTGIDRTHPALAGKVIGGWDFANDDADAMDDHRHGTHVAGIIAAESAQMTGVAPGVSLLAYKALDENGNGDMSAVIAALERAHDPNGDGAPSHRAARVNLTRG